MNNYPGYLWKTVESTKVINCVKSNEPCRSKKKDIGVISSSTIRALCFYFKTKFTKKMVFRL